jgi:hypothetical protein
MMLLDFLRKKDCWAQIGGVHGYIDAVNILGSAHRELDKESSGYTNPDSIWGQLAEFTGLHKKNTYENRKWLFTMWREDRRKVRTTFIKAMTNDDSLLNADQSLTNNKVRNRG